MMRPIKISAFLSAVLVAGTGFAAVEPIAPVGGETVALVPEAQKKVMAPPTLAGRLKVFDDDKAVRHDDSWRKSVPLVLKWNATEREGTPWKIEIGKMPDLSDARTWFISDKECEYKDGQCSYVVPMANLEVGEEYRWRVTGRARCAKPDCGRKCGCKESKKSVASAVATFRTEDVAPRWIAVEGKVDNIRDLGGRRTADGRRVKQGMAYRGQGLNDNSATGEEPGRNRLTAEDIKYLTGTLGIRTDLDLRGKSEWGGSPDYASPLGSDVRWVNFPISSYSGILNDRNKKFFREIFALLSKPDTYPVYTHCWAGADRCGTLNMGIKAVLGVSDNDIFTDYELTSFAVFGERRIGSDEMIKFREALKQYGENEPFSVQFVNYLKECGVTDEELDSIRGLLLEDAQ